MSTQIRLGFVIFRHMSWYSLSSLGLSISGAQRGFHETLSKLIIFFKEDFTFSCVLNLLLVLPFELSRLYVVGINWGDKGSFCWLCPMVGGGVVKLDQSTVNVGSNKSYYNKNSNGRILPKDYNIPFSSMKYATQNERKSFSIGKRATLFGLNTL